MSTDGLAELLDQLRALSREFGEFRHEFRQSGEEIRERLCRIEQRLGKVEREQRLTNRRLDRLGSLALVTRADIDELQERVAALEDGDDGGRRERLGGGKSGG